MRWAIIGAGYAGRNMAITLRGTPESRAAAIYSCTQSRAKALARECDARVYASREELLADPAVDALDIARRMRNMRMIALPRSRRPDLDDQRGY